VPIRLPPVSARCRVGRCRARASRERRSGGSGALPRQRCFATEEACEAYLAGCRPPDGFRGPRRGQPKVRSPPARRVAAGSPTPRVGLVRVLRLDDGGDRAPSDSDHRGASLAGGPDRRPSRPLVSPTYAQGSYYGTNRLVAGAPGRLTGPAASLLSTTRAAQLSGRDRRRSRSSRSTNRARISEQSDARAGREGGTRGREARAEEPDAGTRGQPREGGHRAGITRRHLAASLDEFVFRYNRGPNLAAAFGTLLGPVAITGADDLRHGATAIRARSSPTLEPGARDPLSSTAEHGATSLTLDWPRPGARLTRSCRVVVSTGISDRNHRAR
jgi:hypothetical protein